MEGFDLLPESYLRGGAVGWWLEGPLKLPGFRGRVGRFLPPGGQVLNSTFSGRSPLALKCCSDLKCHQGVVLNTSEVELVLLVYRLVL